MTSTSGCCVVLGSIAPETPTAASGAPGTKQVGEPPRVGSPRPAARGLVQRGMPSMPRLRDRVSVISHH
eukprot:scaffold2580_cov388-Prasinococcus_capsulatus_cf.AAC.25